LLDLEGGVGVGLAGARARHALLLLLARVGALLGGLALRLGRLLLRLAARLRDVARGLARGFGLVARGQRHAGAQKGRRQDLRTHGSTSLGLTGGSRGTAWEVGGARVVPSTPDACAPRSGGAG